MSAPRFRLLLAAAAAPLFAFAPGAHAQDTARADFIACRQAADLVRAYDQAVVQSDGHASEGSGKAEQRRIAAARLLSCGGEGGATAAATIRSTRFLTDSAVLNALVGPFGDFRDSAVVDASMSVAADPSASVEACVFALRALWVLRTGKFWIGYDRMLPTDASTPTNPVAACDDGLEVTDAKPTWSHGVEPPAGFESAIVVLAQQLAADTEQPMAVRAAATCAARPS